MIKHSMWQTTEGYRPDEDRPWVLDTWDSERWHVQRSYLGFNPTGIYVRSVKTLHRITIESIIATESYP